MTKNGSRNGRRAEPRVGAEKRHEEAERIRCGEVSRALRKMDLSPEGETAVEGLTRSLLGRSGNAARCLA